jgi:spermidine synthase
MNVPEASLVISQENAGLTNSLQFQQSVEHGESPNVFVEKLYDHSWVSIVKKDIKAASYVSESGKQKLELFYTEPFGFVLAIDDVIQFMSSDTSYPEYMAHVAMFAHRHTRVPKRALVVGGGDMEIARELLRHVEDGGPLKEIVVVDIDPEVTRLVKSYAPEMGSIWVGKGKDRRKTSVFGIPWHPAVTVIHEDASKFVEWARREKQKFGVVICDTTDERSVATPLFGVEFLKDVYDIMDKGAILVRLAGSLALQRDEVKKVLRQSYAVFRHSGATALLRFPTLRYAGGEFAAVVSCKDEWLSLMPTHHSYARWWVNHELQHYSLELHKFHLMPKPWMKEFFGK